MNKQRKTSHILNVFQYDADGHVVLPASLTLGIVPGAEDNSGKVPSTAWVRGLVSTTGSSLVPTNRSITINGTSYDLSSNRSWSIDTGVLTASAGSGISVSVVNQNLNIVNTGLLTGTAGAGISVSTVNQNLNIVNTGLLSATAGSGISVSTVNQNLNIVNTGILTASAGAGVSLSVVSQNLNIINTGILTATAGAGISLSVVSGNLNIVNTITDNNQLANGAGYATTGYVSTQINNLVAGAPGLLDTLDELAAALGDDPSFATTVTTSIATKVPQTRTITINGTSYDLSANRSWTINSMVYPSAGIAVSTGTAWGTSITDNSSNWNTAFGWGNHASAGYLTTSSAASTYVSLTGSYANPSWITSLAYSKITGVPAFLTSYTETDTLATVTGRGSSTSTALTLSGKVTFSSSVSNRPQLPGGFLGLDTSDGNFDIWGISRDYYPSHATPANAWGLRWNGDNNDFEFVGGGTSRVILDMDGGNITATGTLSASNYSGTHSGSSSGTNTGDQTNISGNSATTSQRSFSGDISTDGMGRFTGWYTGTAATTLATEVGVSSGIGHIIVYNRQTSTYGSLNIHAVNINIDPQGGSARVGGSQIVTNNGGTWGISISGNAATSSVAYNLQASDATQIRFNSVINTDYSTMTFMSRAWSAVQGANGLAYNFTTHNNNGGGGYGALQIYYGEGGYVAAPTSFRAPIFYDSSDTGYYGDFASTSRMNNLVLGSYYQPSYTGQLILGHTSYNFNFLNGSWASSVTAGILANCADEFEFAIHDSGNSVESLFIYQGGRILMGRSIGWGTTYIEAAESFRAPIFYDSSDTTYYGDFASTSYLRHLSVGDVNTSNDGGWNARFNLTGSSHARLDVKSNSDGIITTIYSHTGQGVGRVGTYSNHPLAFMVNGNIAGYAYANYLQGVDSVRAPIFYDSNDTGYYLDPNSSSRLYQTLTNLSYFGTDTNKGYGQGYGTYSSQLHKIARITFDWDSNYNQENHGIFSTDINGSYTDSMSLNSFNDITLRLDSNDNNTNSYLRISNNTTGNGTIAWIGYESGMNQNYFSGSVGISTGPRTDGYKLNMGGSIHLNGNSVDYVGSLYFNNAGHIQPNAGSYGALQMTSNKNGWAGIRFTDYNTNLMSNATTSGVHHNDYGWQFRWESGNMYVHSGTYGGGSAYTVIHSGNIGSQSVSYASNSGNSTNTARGIIEDTRSGQRTPNDYTDYRVSWEFTNQIVSGWHSVMTLQGWHDGYAAWQIIGPSDSAHENWYLRSGNNTSWNSLRSIIHSGNIASQTVSNSDMVDGYHASNFLGFQGNSYYQANTWIQLNGYHGLYAPSANGAHWMPNNASTYTTWRIAGSRNSYSGVYDDYSGVNMLMFDSGGNGGAYRENNGRWYWYHHLSNNCTGISTSSTSSSYRAYIGGALYAEGDIVAYSDVRKKTDIVTIDNALEKVTNLRGVYYTRIDDTARGRQTGVIAQEINEVLPEVVTYAADVDEYGVSYGNIVGVLIEAIKEQQLQIEELQNKLDNVLSSR